MGTLETATHTSMETRLTVSAAEMEETQLFLFLEAKEWRLETDILNDESEVVERSLFDSRIKNLKQGKAPWMVLLQDSRETESDANEKLKLWRGS